VGVTPLIKSPQSIDVAGQANAHALADGAGILRCRREPQWTWGAQIQAVLAEINLHRLGKPARTPCQIGQASHGAEALHYVYSRKRFERA
jgi:hypothetical protein